MKGRKKDENTEIKQEGKGMYESKKKKDNNDSSSSISMSKHI
jgi:hypothetical protein